MSVQLPIDEVLPDVLAALTNHGAVVVVAPPGSGKTTRIPPALLDGFGGRKGITSGGKILVLQPRRVAARTTARWMAEARGERVGETIGYSVRFERKTGRKTRIEVVTEGLLTRRLQADPFLEGVDAVVLDEFHERSLHADLALALLAEVRRDVRPDLAVVVMSATLAAEPVAAFLGDAPIVRSDGRIHPVELLHEPPMPGQDLLDHTADAIAGVIAAMDRGDREDGHVLVFLSGAGAIGSLQRRIQNRIDADVMPLHGSLSTAEQDRAVAPSRRRKVVLATNIAETSLTIDGVVCVIDTGRVKVARLDPPTGLQRLVDERISRASAEQRAGRAGRTGPGTCIRLWSAPEHRGLRPFLTPAVGREDLSRAIVEVHAWGSSPREFTWFETPAGGEIERVEELLGRIGLLDGGHLTEDGTRVAAWPVHPRTGCVLLAGLRAGRARDAASVAALIEEGDVLVDAPGVRGDDVEIRLDALDRWQKRRGGTRGVNARRVHGRGAQRFVAVRDALLRAMGKKSAGGRPTSGDADWAELVLAGFPERVGRKRLTGTGRYVLANGHGAKLGPRSALVDAPYIVAVSMRAGQRGEGAEHIVDIGCLVEPAALATETVTETRFDPSTDRATTFSQTRYGELVLSERPTATDHEAASAALLAAVRADPSRAIELDRDANRYLERVRFVVAAMPELDLPSFAELDTAGAQPHACGCILEAACAGRRSLGELRKVDWIGLMRGLLGGRGIGAVDRHAPARIGLPSGRSARVDYSHDPPVLAARIQHLFGLATTPRLAGGRVNAVVHLLAPNGRPAQVTSDLASFWATTYADVRKQLRGRYPKHAWPEDPLR